MWLYLSTLCCFGLFIDAHRRLGRSQGDDYIRALLVQWRRFLCACMISAVVLSAFQAALDLEMLDVGDESSIRTLEATAHAINAKLAFLRSITKVREAAALLALLFCAVMVPAVAKLSLVAKYKRYSPYVEVTIMTATIVTSFSFLAPYSTSHGERLVLSVRAWTRSADSARLELHREAARLARALAVREVASEWGIATTVRRDLAALRDADAALAQSRPRLAREGQADSDDQALLSRLSELRRRDSPAAANDMVDTAERGGWNRSNAKAAASAVRSALPRGQGFEAEVLETVEKGVEAFETETVKPAIGDLFEGSTAGVPTELVDVLIEALMEQPLREAMKLGARRIILEAAKHAGGIDAVVDAVRTDIRKAASRSMESTRRRAVQVVERLNHEVARSFKLVEQAKQRLAALILSLELSILDAEASSRWGKLRKEYRLGVEQGRIRSSRPEVITLFREAADSWEPRRKELAKTWAAQGSEVSVDTWERAYVEFLLQRPDRAPAWGWIVKEHYNAEIERRYKWTAIPMLGFRLYGEETGLISQAVFEQISVRQDVVEFIVTVCLGLDK